MPTIDDYDKNDDSSGSLSSDGYSPAQSVAIGSATGAPQMAPQQKQQADSYVPWSSFVSANQDVSNREAGKLQNEVQGDVTKAQGDLSNAQSSFNSGIAGDYSTPAAAAASSSAAAAPTKGARPSNSQSTPPAESAEPSPWSTLSPSTSASQRAPAAQKTAQSSTYNGPRTALDGALPPQPSPGAPAGGTTPQSRAPAAQKQAQAPSAAMQTAQAGAQQQAQQQAPWASLAGSVDTPVKAGTTPQTQGGAQMLSYGRSRDLTPGAAAGNPTGPQDLESAAGPAAWSSLVGDTVKAQQEANALGSTTGVQGLLQSQATDPTAGGQAGSAFDAALLSGQGGPGFRALAQKYGGDQLGQNVINAEQASQDRWKQLQGDISTRQAFDAASKAAAPINAPVTQLATPAPIVAGSAPATPGAANDGFDPATYSYGQSMADQFGKGNQNQEWAVGDSNTGYGDNTPLGNWSTFGPDAAPSSGGKGQSINVGTTKDAQGNTVEDWSGWFGGADTGNQSPQQMGLTQQEIWALSLMSPQQRGDWLKKHNGG